MFLDSNKYENLKLFGKFEDTLRTYNNLRRVFIEMELVFNNLKDTNTNTHLIRDVMVSSNKREAIKEYLKELSAKMLTLSTANVMGFDNETKFNYSVKVQDVLLGLLSGVEIHDSGVLFQFLCTYMFGFNIDFIKSVVSGDYNEMMMYFLNNINYDGAEIVDDRLCVHMFAEDFNFLKGDSKEYLNTVLEYIWNDSKEYMDFVIALFMKTN